MDQYKGFFAKDGDHPVEAPDLRLLWIAVTIAAVVLFVIWLFSMA